MKMFRFLKYRKGKITLQRLRGREAHLARGGSRWQYRRSYTKPTTPLPVHHCHAKNCERPTNPRLLMCKKHWSLVPFLMRDKVWHYYRPGQEVDKKPSPEWYQAAMAAIEYVADHERKAARFHVS